MDEPDLVFHKHAGRPKQYKTAKERTEARLASRRKWYATKGKERVEEYNKTYYEENREKQLKRVHDAYVKNKRGEEKELGKELTKLKKRYEVLKRKSKK